MSDRALIRALQSSPPIVLPHPASDEGMTLNEIAAHIGRSREWTRLRLSRLVASGQVSVGYRPSVDVLGRPIRTPVYKFVGAAQQ